MEKIVKIGALIDLCGILRSTKKKSVSCSMIVRLLQPISCPQKYQDCCSEDICWFNAGMIIGQVNVDVTDFAAATIYETVTQDMGVLYGCVQIAIPKNYKDILIPGCNDLFIKGKAYLERGSLNTVHVLQWRPKYVEGIGKTWYVQANSISLPDLSLYERGLRLFYREVQHNTMNTVLKRFFDITNIVPCGLPVNKTVVGIQQPEVRYAQWDNITNKLTPISTKQLMAKLPEITTENVTTDLQGAIYDDTGIIKRGYRTYYNRTEFYSYDSYVTQLEHLIAEKRELRERYIKGLQKYKSKAVYNKCVTALNSSLLQYWSKKAVSLPRVFTGRKLLESALCLFIDYGFCDTLAGHLNVNTRAKVKAVAHMICTQKQLASKLIQNWYRQIVSYNKDKDKDNTVLLNKTDYVEVLGKSVYQQAEQLLLCIVQVVLALSCDLVFVDRQLRKQGCNLWALIEQQPYAISLICAGVSLSDCDKLAALSGVFGSKKMLEQRCVAYLHQIHTDLRNDWMNGSTLKYKQSYHDLQYKLPVPAQCVESVTMFGLYETVELRQNASTFLGLDVNAAFKLPAGFYAEGFYKIDISISDMLLWYLQSPYGVEIQHNEKTAIMDVDCLTKELSIYNKCKSCSKPLKKAERIPEKRIETYVTEYSIQKAKEWGKTAVNLEPKQRAALSLVNTRMFALVGGAGTGKTTLLELITKIIQNEHNIEDDAVLYIAPTGKAAVRMREVVHKNTMTIHSACALGVQNTVVTVDNTKVRSLEQYRIIVVDEASMVDLATMYMLMEAIPENSWVIFIGDVGQLPAIGGGKPFAAMLKYIPVCTLDTIKRTNEDDVIAQNGNALFSGRNTPVVSGSNFVIMNVPEPEITKCIEAICKYHLQGIETTGLQYIKTQQPVTENDIQVITPVKRKVYQWGCLRLNKQLQPVFNQKLNTKPIRVVGHKNTENNAYTIGDRVIHLENDKDAVRYIQDAEDTLLYRVSSKQATGVMNGEIGIVKHIVDGKDVKFETDNEEYINNDLKVMLQEKRSRKVYMFVEYQDIDVETMLPVSYLICYPLTKWDKADESADVVEKPQGISALLVQQVPEQTRVVSNTDNVVGTYRVLDSDLQMLQLAYAVTVHKMQGSQIKMAICVVYAVQQQHFLNRNLLYTMLTRATDGVYLLGDISGDSAFNKALNVDVLQQRLCLFD